MELLNQFKQLQIEYETNSYPTLQERKRILLDLKKGLQSYAYVFVESVNKDFTQRSEVDTLFCDVFPTIKAINFCLAKIKYWMKNRKRDVSWQFMPAYAYLAPQPLGVVGIMVPWNYPIMLSLIPAVYAIAAGNRVMIKMSELSIHTGLVLQELIRTLGLSHYIDVINSGDVAVSKQFAELPFGHLMFTGSTKVGRQVMQAASLNLTPVTLELGGKSPVLITTSMNLNYFKRVFMGKMLNAAQTCIAPDYLLVPSGWSDRIENEFKKFIAVHYPDLMNSNSYSSIISKSHKQRLLNLLDDARDKGARVVAFGDLNEDDCKMPVYLLFNVTSDMRVMQEELFGPILPVLTYNTFTEAMAYINSMPNPLALYYFGEDKAEIKLLQTQTLSGALLINDTVIHVAVDDLPFGGVGASGMGHYHGREGFDAFSKLKPIMVQRRLSPMVLLYPPYGKLMRLVLSWFGGINKAACKKKHAALSQ
jgi:coniferyl-aldehyde dehydrogenase